MLAPSVPELLVLYCESSRAIYKREIQERYYVYTSIHSTLVLPGPTLQSIIFLLLFAGECTTYTHGTCVSSSTNVTNLLQSRQGILARSPRATLHPISYPPLPPQTPQRALSVLRPLTSHSWLFSEVSINLHVGCAWLAYRYAPKQ